MLNNRLLFDRNYTKIKWMYFNQWLINGFELTESFADYSGLLCLKWDHT